MFYVCVECWVFNTGMGKKMKKIILIVVSIFFANNVLCTRNTLDEEALLNASWEADKGLVDSLLKKGTNPNVVDVCGRISLYRVVQSFGYDFRYPEPNLVVALLLEAKANPNIQEEYGNTALHGMVESRNTW